MRLFVFDMTDQLRIEYWPLSKLALWDRNPKMHDIGLLVKSFGKYGFRDGIIFDETLKAVVAGNGRAQALTQMKAQGQKPPRGIEVREDDWYVPVQIGIAARTKKEAEAFAIDHNNSALSGGDFDAAEIAKMWDTSYLDVLQDLQASAEQVLTLDNHDLDTLQRRAERAAQTSAELEELPPEAVGGRDNIYALREDIRFPGNNQWGIPDLRTDRLVIELPEKIVTWGGQEATPDDGISHYLYNYGRVGNTGLPWDRTILCFYTYDTYFEKWWTFPAYYTAWMMSVGVTKAVVPDFSLWTDEPRVVHLFNCYRAQWLGRYFQEAGMNVIPRVQWADESSLEYCLSGIPIGAPVVAMCIQTVDQDNEQEFTRCKYGIVESVSRLKPECVLLYGGNSGHRMAASLGLPCKFVNVLNYAGIRRKQKVIGRDDALKNLRTRPRDIVGRYETLSKEV